MFPPQPQTKACAAGHETADRYQIQRQAVPEPSVLYPALKIPPHPAKKHTQVLTSCQARGAKPQKYVSAVSGIFLSFILWCNCVSWRDRNSEGSGSGILFWRVGMGGWSCFAIFETFLGIIGNACFCLLVSLFPLVGKPPHVLMSWMLSPEKWSVVFSELISGAFSGSHTKIVTCFLQNLVVLDFFSCCAN